MRWPPAVAAVCLACVSGVHADVLIETVPVGNPGNEGELSGSGAGGGGPDRICGAVDYVYNIGKFEVTARQYTAFLNAVADEDTYGLYSPDMWSSDWGCKIERAGSAGSYTYSVAPVWADRPVNYVSWGDAARFSNWLHNGQPTGAQDLATTEDGSYFLNGATSSADLVTVTREGDWNWAVTSEDEWYKAAYHKNDGVTGNYWDYPTSSDSMPGRDMTEATSPGNNANYYGTPYPIDPPHYTTVVGEFELSDSPYGTFDQGGNLWEWNETVAFGCCRRVRGGRWASGCTILRASQRDSYAGPACEDSGTGFRVVEVPEPATIALLALGGLLVARRRR